MQQKPHQSEMKNLFQPETLLL